MLAPFLVFALIGCFGLLAALRPEVYARYCLVESQRRALSGNFKALSFTGWIIFGACMGTAIALLFTSKWKLAAPVVSPLLFLVCAVAYAWWGIGFLRKPDSFLKRTTEPWSHIPVFAVKIFGALLLLGAAGFAYGFLLRLKGFWR